MPIRGRTHVPAASRRWSHFRVPIGILGLLLVAAFGQRLAAHLPGLLDMARDLGPWAGVAFVGAYALATVAWVPGSLLTLAAGATFGLVWGTVYTLLGASLGASLAFLVSRSVARAAVERRMRADVRLQALDEALVREGPRLVLLLRLSPAFPFNALNYALGLMPVRLRDYVVMSLVGMAPGTFLYVYGGYAAGQLMADASGAGTRTAVDYLLLGVGLAATVAATALVTRAARSALGKAGAVADSGDPHANGAAPSPSSS